MSKPCAYVRPWELPLDMECLGDIPLLRLDPEAARMIEEERRRLKPQPFSPDPKGLFRWR